MIKLFITFATILVYSLFPITTLANAATKPMSVYFAGSLFSQKDLIGNLYLAESISLLSNGKYESFMVQNKVQQKVTHKAIKDQDLVALTNSDVALFAFDGTELDSGTVVEFIAAKFLDKPAVVYRTDFRGGSGEESIDELSNKWNLMVSFYPRTKIVYINAMVEYQKVFNKNKGQPASVISKIYSETIARKLIDAMDEVVLMPNLLSKQEYFIMEKQYKKLMNIQD